MEESSIHKLMKRYLCLALLVASSGAAKATSDDLWAQTASALGIGATMKASYKPSCQPDNPLSTLPQYKLVCPKIDRVPDKVIETAILPYLQRYLTEADAKAALAFWSSPRGQALLGKILREIETGVYDQLTTTDLMLLNETNRSHYGQALLEFSRDRGQTAAVLHVIRTYEPSP